MLLVVWPRDRVYPRVCGFTIRRRAGILRTVPPLIKTCADAGCVKMIAAMIPKTTRPFLQFQSQIQPGFFQGLNESIKKHCYVRFSKRSAASFVEPFVAPPPQNATGHFHCSSSHPSGRSYHPASSRGSEVKTDFRAGRKAETSIPLPAANAGWVSNGLRFCELCENVSNFFGKFLNAKRICAKKLPSEVVLCVLIVLISYYVANRHSRSGGNFAGY